jgi:putative nucleotidyltransferase with HDIG domain
MKEEQRQLFEQLKSSKNLPTLPHILLRIIEVCNGEETNFKELSRIIETDPALTSNILRMINSPYFSLPNKVFNLDQALVLIGMDAVKNIAISASIHQVFKTEQKSSPLHLKAFWRHSLMCALLARALAKKLQYPNPDEAFLTGLLHDIGKLVLWVNFPKEYEKAVVSSQGSSDRLLSEEAKLGALHSEVGAWIIGDWGLPSLVADAILYHHEPLYRVVEAFALVRIVYLANILSKDEEGNSREASETLFGLSQEETQILRGQARADLANTAKFMDIAVDIREEARERADQEKKQKLLTQQVKDISLLLGTLQNLIRATDESTLIKILYQSLKILFGIKTALFFKYDYERDLLVSRGVEGNGLSPLIISYDKSSCILVQSLKKQAVLNTFEKSESRSIADEQIIRFLKKEGLLCFPLITNRSRVGVLAVGVNRAEVPVLSKLRRRVALLTNHVALALHTDNLRAIQRKQIQNERLEASSDTAKRIVHEANNPLGIIKNYLAIMSKKLTDESPVKEEMQIIGEEIDRVTHLLEELSEFSEPSKQAREPTVKEPTDVNGVISDLITLSKQTILSQVSVKLNLDKSLPALMVPRDSLKQILLNLIKNSAEAMPKGGEITLSTKYHKSFPLEEIPEIAIDKGDDAGYVQIIVSDNGSGIPETLRLHIFEPFVSTKAEGHQGIGLSVVYNTVKALRGTITLRSRKGEGTRFAILFAVTSETNE